jgi:hypothetical protein
VENYSTIKPKSRTVWKTLACDRGHDPAMSLTEKFTSHPQSVGETYAEHAVMASGFGFKLILAGLACLVHAILPFLFVKTGSGMIADLYQRMVAHRRRH